MRDYQDILRQWQTQKIETPADLDTILNNFRILFAYHSNVIENPEITYHDTREIFENGKVVGFTGELRTLYEIENQKKCYLYLKEKILNRELLSEELIKEIHRILLNGCCDEARYKKGERPGEYKKHEYVVGDNIGILPEDVSEEISSLCEQINGYDEDDYLTPAAWLHLNFEYIHPFADGNGRVGRTLMNYYLIIHGYPPTVFYQEDKAAYYMALAVFDHTEEITGFKEYIKEQTIKTWDHQPMRVNERKSLSQWKSEMEKSYLEAENGEPEK